MVVVLLIALLAVLIWGWQRHGGGRSDTEVQLAQRNQQWTNFIAAYLSVAKSPAEKAIVQRMLDDVARQNLGQVEKHLPTGAAAVPAELAATAAASRKPPVQLDNTSLLLYFGAFLFVASVGLFVAVGGANGSLRTFAVLVVMAVMYGGGIWLYRNRPKLRQAGLAFTGIGLVIAPLLGAAAYSYIFKQSHASLVWAVTSLLCLALYSHALYALRKPLIGYLLIFTFLSLFESGISLARLPLYYFGWGMAAIGILLQLTAYWRGYWPELREPSRLSARLLLPLTLFVSIVLEHSQGSGQLGVSLLLAAAFYGLEAAASPTERSANARASQLAAISGLNCLAYATAKDWQAVILVMAAASAVQLLLLLRAPAQTIFWRRFATILMLAAVADCFFAARHPVELLGTLALLTIIAAAVWWRQMRAEAFGLRAAAWISLPFVYGQQVVIPALTPGYQTMLAFAAFLVLVLAFAGQTKERQSAVNWPVYGQLSVLVGMFAVLVSGAVGTPLQSLAATLAVVAALLYLAERMHDAEWAEVAAAILFLPLMKAVPDRPVFLLTDAIAVALLIAMTLRYRQELLRWFGTVFWLVLPLALGRGHWTAAMYAWAYLVALIGMVAARSIARGVVLFAANKPIASYGRKASLAYVVGYVASAGLMLGLSLASPASRLHTSILLTITMLIVGLLSVLVEKRLELVAALPILAQALWWSVIRPTAGGSGLVLFLVGSSLLAVTSYAWAQRRQQTVREAVGTISLLLTVIAPLSLLPVGRTVWPMPLGLLAAGGLLSYHLRHRDQNQRELAGGVIVLAVIWGLYFLGVHRLQAYTHLLAATLGIYAYWRNKLHQSAASDSYLKAMLAMATVPLALQALQGAAGGIYGWWLLLEEVGFMLLGIALHRRFVTLWGLYVAVAAVLYQLRHLGWAALTVLALFIIGLATYRLQKHADN